MYTFMVFDGEAVGLHGETFAVGYVVIEESGIELESGLLCSPLETAHGQLDGHRWCEDNVVPALKHELPSTYAAKTYGCPRDVREYFWRTWMRWKTQGAILAAECAWPVETNFLSACVHDDMIVRKWNGPYPFLDVATIRLAAGLDPLETVERLELEKPIHNPLADARQSARLLVEALARIKSGNLGALLTHDLAP